MAAGLNAPTADTARTISDLRAQIKAGDGASRQVAYHLDLCDGGRVGDRSRLTRRSEAAPAVERDRGLIARRDPEEEATSSTRPRPGGHALDEGETDPASALRAVDEHANEHRS